MKNLAVVFITLMVFGLVSVSESQAGRFEKRDVWQHERIGDGIKDGSITRHEANILRNEQQMSDNQKDRAMRDGHLSKRERIRLERRQDLANRHIYRMRHNDRGRCDRDCYDHVSFRSGAVVFPLLLPPLPPPPFVLPGMQIRIFSSR
ncbi:MAG: hypothetical protein EHM85_13840 [Desulfobacteraceae bacterium]|nr:MAG: hypothetical protein EHM85_13840 [Desulfobacteraceae bacterium]